MRRKAHLLDEPVSDMSADSDLEPNDTDPKTPITAPLTPLSSGRKTLSCPYEGCAKLFNRQARLSEHIRSHTNDRPFTCLEEACDKAFLRDSHLKHHIKSAHTNERNYTCNWANCDKKFATGTRLRRHEASHEKREKYTCKGFEGCSETFRKHATLSRHILSVHEDKRPFPCTEHIVETGEQCSSGFDTAEKLRSHKRAIHDHTRFVCMDCTNAYDGLDAQVSFATYALLQGHMSVVHPPTCPQCSQLCSSEKDLRRHLELAHNMIDLLVENGSNPAFPCTYGNCTRSFTKKGNLSVHISSVHEHRKDFVCGQTELKLALHGPHNHNADGSESSEITGCGRHFTSKATLEEHVRTVHLGLNSKRQERNRKRRAERADDGDLVIAEEGASINRTKRRKGQGGKSAIADLTGSANVPVGAPFDPHLAVRDPFNGIAYPTSMDYNPVAFDPDFDAQTFPQQDYHATFFTAPVPREEYSTETSFGSTDLNKLAASVLVDPVLL
jgi:general transcription factor IIIA